MVTNGEFLPIVSTETAANILEAEMGIGTLDLPASGRGLRDRVCMKNIAIKAGSETVSELPEGCPSSD